MYVLDVLGLTDWNRARSIAARRVRDAVRKRPPPFREMVTYPQWVRVIHDAGEEAIYAQALMAVDLLIMRHGRPAVVHYFRLFDASEDRLSNFREAFGEDLD